MIKTREFSRYLMIISGIYSIDFSPAISINLSFIIRLIRNIKFFIIYASCRFFAEKVSRKVYDDRRSDILTETLWLWWLTKSVFYSRPPLSYNLIAPSFISEWSSCNIFLSLIFSRTYLLWRFKEARDINLIIFWDHVIEFALKLILFRISICCVLAFM